MKWTGLFNYLIIASIVVACDNKPPYSTIQGPEIPGPGSKWPYNDINWLGEAGGRLSLGMDGPNRPVSQKNADTVSIRILDIVLYITSLAKEKVGVPAQKATARIKGSQFGYALFSGSFSGKESDYSFDYSAAFYDYSNDGELFLGGKLNCKGSGGFIPNTEDTGYENTVFNGAIEFAGSYRGSLAFNNVKTINSCWYERYTGSLLVNSYDDSFIYNLLYSTRWN